MADVLPLCIGYNVLLGTIHISTESELVSELFDVLLAIDIYLIEAYHVEHRLFPSGVPPLILDFYFNTPIKYRRKTPMDQPFPQTDP
jgi:hypothetical protein